MPRGYWNGRASVWTEADIAMLRQWYADRTNRPLDLDELSKRLGRLKSNVCRKARGLGLSNRGRAKVTTEEGRAAWGARTKAHFAKHGHPKGMMGKKHSESTKFRISMHTRAMNDSRTPSDWDAMTRKSAKTRMANGTNGAPKIKRGSWKAGWREVGGKRLYARSLWEANVARYLEWLKSHDEIREWEHEPETFWFEQIRRGVRSYKPDFRVTRPDGGVYYLEVKGWMDTRSRTCLKRMKKYYPKVELELMDSTRYRQLSVQCRGMIAGWE